MALDKSQPTSSLPYDDWKLQLRKDCELQGKLFAFDGIGEFTLKLLWKDGINPTVDGIIGNATRPQSG